MKRIETAGAVLLAVLATAGCDNDGKRRRGGGASDGPPVATSASFTLDYAARQVLAGQVDGTDPDGDGLTFAVASRPQNGHVQMDPDGAFHYAPRCGFTGADSFTFVANDGDASSAPATVTVTTTGTLDANLLQAREITAATLAADRIDGPLARGGIGDFVMENDQIKVIVQKAGRQWATINPHGGTIIDAVPRCSDNGVPLDHFEDMAIGVNIETTMNPTVVEVVADPPADTVQVRATGPDDLIDFINGSSAIRDLGFTFPAGADDVDLPVTIETLYTLRKNAQYVEMQLTVAYAGAQPRSIYLVQYLNGSGEVEVFQHGYGFGEILAALPCSGATPLSATATAPGPLDPCNYVAYAGNDRGAGVSYGFIHDENGTSSVSVSGVTVPALGVNVVTVFAGADTPNYTLLPSPLPAFTQTHRFAVGQGTVAHVLDIRNAIYGVQTGTLSGTVTSGGQPLADAEIAVLGQAYAPGPALNVVNHYRTGLDGAYRMTLPPGNYTVRANRDGRLSPADRSAGVASGQTVTADFDFPAPARLRVTVADNNGLPIPAKVQLVGFDGSPPVVNDASVPGVLTQSSGVFGDLQADKLPYGIAFTEFVGKTGDSGVWEVEPGDYQFAVSRGPRYSAHLEPITLVEGETLTKAVVLAQVVPTPGYVTGDFHVHSIDSPDSEVTQVERVATYLAEGTDFFTPSDHEMRVDFQPVIDRMQVGHLIGTAPSAEITTFDYGHFNSWPVTVMTPLLGGGSVDWGGEAPAGEDFPSAGHYVLAPEQLIAAAHDDPMANIVQVNHMESHFGPAGLRIDTGVAPPQSGKPAEDRRLDPAIANFFSDDFDALEIWISVDGRNENADTGAPYTNFLDQNLGDWFNLLNQGLRRTAVADSDTHERRLTSLANRTLIPSAVTAPGQLSPQAEALAAKVRNGYAIGTNAPFVTISAHAPSTGQDAGLGLNESTVLRTSNGAVNVTVDVKSPLWAEFDRVEFYVNSQPQPYTLAHDAGDQTRYRACPQATFDRADPVANPTTQFAVTTVTDDPAIPGAGHLEASVTLSLSGLTQDAWIVAMVRGTDGVSRPMFPVVPNDLAPDGNNTTLEGLTDGNLGEKGMPVLAFTNPIFVSADGNAQWDPPGVAAGTCP